MTNELKLRAFAAYPGAKVMHKGRERTLLGIAFATEVVELSDVDDKQGIIIANIWDCQLILTPLDQITDEHAIEVAKYRTGNLNEQHCTFAVDRRFGAIYVQKFIRLNFINDYKISLNYLYFNINQIDFLRSQNYLLPFAGHDLVAEGIAIVNSKTDNI